MHSTVESVHASPVTTPQPIEMTVQLATRIFPFTPTANIAANLPHVLAANRGFT